MFLLSGFNSTVVAYGHHGTGKTYTMTGPDFLWAMNEREFGLLPQSVRHIFKLMNDTPDREYRVHVSYLIINQEAVYDLLSLNGHDLSPLNVLEDSLVSYITTLFEFEFMNCFEKYLIICQAFFLSLNCDFKQFCAC